MRDINVNTLKPETQKVRLLDLVLRCTPEFRDDFDLVEDEVGRGLIKELNEWEPCSKHNVDLESEPLKKFAADSYKMVKFEKADERIPKNYYDLSIKTNLMEFVFDSAIKEVKKVKVPNIPGAFVLTNVLSANDCR